jgi:hypothetical protein
MVSEIARLEVESKRKETIEAVAGTCRSYSSCVAHEAVRTRCRDNYKEKKKKKKVTWMGAPTQKSVPFHTY